MGRERYLIPEALRSNEPDYDIWPADSLRFRYQYDFLPPGLIPRFIVEAHLKITDKKTRWRTGVVLSAVGCHVLVKGDVDKRCINLFVDGPVDHRRSALNVITTDLEAVNKFNPESVPMAMVPLPDQPEIDVPYNHLVELKEKEGIDYEFYPQGAKKKYSIRQLLEGVERDRNYAYEEKVPKQNDFVDETLARDTNNDAEINAKAVVKAAKIGAAGAVLAALIGGGFLYFSNSNKESSLQEDKMTNKTTTQKSSKTEAQK